MMKQLSTFANEALDVDTDCGLLDDEIDVLFDEFCEELASDEEKVKANESKERFKSAVKKHAASIKRGAGKAANAGKSFMRSMWHDSHV